jgi:arsenate reductase
MAEGFAKIYGKDLLMPCSAGTHPAKSVDPNAITVMAEKGIHILDQRPKLVEEIPEDRFDYVITMGYGVNPGSCPIFAAPFQEDWGLGDPKDKTLDFYRKVRDEIEIKVQNLIARLKGKTNES